MFDKSKHQDCVFFAPVLVRVVLRDAKAESGHAEIVAEREAGEASEIIFRFRLT